MSSPKAQTGTLQAPLPTAAKCRVALGLTIRRLVEHARALIPTEGDNELRPGELILAVRRLRTLALTSLEYAVVCEVANGATWPQVASALGLDEDTARGRYQERVARWLAGEPIPAGPVLADGSHPVGLPAPFTGIDRGAAAALEAWYLRTRDPCDRVARTGLPQPVTAELDRPG